MKFGILNNVKVNLWSSTFVKESASDMSWATSQAKVLAFHLPQSFANILSVLPVLIRPIYTPGGPRKPFSAPQMA